jgi:hypothetical protein
MSALKLPTIDMVERWSSLAFAPTRGKARTRAGVPIVIPVDGKRALAEIVWANDERQQARFIKAGRLNPYTLSRREYLQLASADSYRVTEGIINGLLAGWAVRAAAESEHELAKHGAHILRALFTARLVELLLGSPKDDREPQWIVLRYLLSENYHQAVELAEVSDRHLQGAFTTEKNAAVKHAKIRAAAKRLKSDYSLQIRTQTDLVEQLRAESELFDKKGKKKGQPPSRSAVLDALKEGGFLEELFKA